MSNVATITKSSLMLVSPYFDYDGFREKSSEEIIENICALGSISIDSNHAASIERMLADATVKQVQLDSPTDVAFVLFIEWKYDISDRIMLDFAVNIDSLFHELFPGDVFYGFVTRFGICFDEGFCGDVFCPKHQKDTYLTHVLESFGLPPAYNTDEVTLHCAVPFKTSKEKHTAFLYVDGGALPANADAKDYNVHNISFVDGILKDSETN